jgi:outer membrane protein TolC
VRLQSWFGSCAIAGILVHGMTAAQPSPLAAAVEAAWARSVQAASAEGQLALAGAQRQAADALWAAPPSLEAAHRSDRLHDNAGRAESEIGVAWPLLLPGQRSARQSAAAADREAAEASLAAARLRIAGEVREAAWAVVARRGEAAVAAQDAQNLQALATDVERRVAAGDLARADFLATQAEFLSASAQAAQARQRLDAATAQWKMLTGLPDIPDPSESGARRGTTHPELVLASLGAAAARAKLELVRATRSDAPELAVRYRRETAASGLPPDNTLGVAIRIPLGTFDRNLPREKAALAELEVALAEERRQRMRLESEAGTARVALAAAEEQLRAEERRAELLRERAALIDKSFRAGETPLPELLRARLASTQAQSALAAQRAALGLALARLNQIDGQLP